MPDLASLTGAQRQTRAFMSLLEPDARHARFGFRTFDDKKDRKKPGRAGKFSGTVDSCEGLLRERNGMGAGAFMVINDGGHTDVEITKVRAVFADTDGAPLEPIVEALTPHAVICSSPGNWHVYWLVEDGFPLDRFTPIQKAIAQKFGTDPMVSNLSRVMRLPGFAHNKGDPFDVHFVPRYLKATLPRYSVQEIVDGLGLPVPGKSRPGGGAQVGAKTPSPTLGVSGSLSDAEAMLEFVDPWGDRKGWIKILFALANQFGEDGRQLAVRWSRGDFWTLRGRLGANL